MLWRLKKQQSLVASTRLADTHTKATAQVQLEESGHIDVTSQPLDPERIIQPGSEKEVPLTMVTNRSKGDITYGERSVQIQKHIPSSITEHHRDTRVSKCPAKESVSDCGNLVECLDQKEMDIVQRALAIYRNGKRQRENYSKLSADTHSHYWQNQQVHGSEGVSSVTQLPLVVCSEPLLLAARQLNSWNRSNGRDHCAKLSNTNYAQYIHTAVRGSRQDPSAGSYFMPLLWKLLCPKDFCEVILNEILMCSSPSEETKSNSIMRAYRDVWDHSARYVSHLPLEDSYAAIELAHMCQQELKKVHQTHKMQKVKEGVSQSPHQLIAHEGDDGREDGLLLWNRLREQQLLLVIELCISRALQSSSQSALDVAQKKPREVTDEETQESKVLRFVQQLRMDFTVGSCLGTPGSASFLEHFTTRFLSAAPLVEAEV